MTREEFTERVGLNVSDGIFEVWNGVYMSSDKDKDEFCKPCLLYTSDAADE